MTSHRIPKVVTERELNRVLDQRDAIVEQTVDRFKVEVVERLDAFAALQDQIERTMIGMLAAIKLSNTLQPDTASQDVQYFVGRDDGFMQSTSVDGFNRARQAGRPAFRQVTVLERYEMDPETFTQAREIVEQVRELQSPSRQEG